MVQYIRTARIVVLPSDIAAGRDARGPPSCVTEAQDRSDIKAGVGADRRRPIRSSLRAVEARTGLQSPSSFYVNVHTGDFAAGAVRAQLAMPSNVKLLSATLTGPNERPSAGDSDGAGTATFLFFPDTPRICYTIAVRNKSRTTSSRLAFGSQS